MGVAIALDQHSPVPEMNVSVELRESSCRVSTVRWASLDNVLGMERDRIGRARAGWVGGMKGVR